MSGIVDNPFVVFAAFLVAQWIAAYLGDFVRSRRRPAKKDELADLDVVQTAALTLLALIIGFSFSMAVSRYDQRKDYEEAEANAIGTEYLRADLLPAESAPAVRNLIRQWLYQRVVLLSAEKRAPRRADRGGNGEAASGTLVGDLAGGERLSDTGHGACRRRHERYAQRAKSYPGRLVEPHSGGGVGIDGLHRNRLQRAPRLQRATKRRAPVAGRADRRVDCGLTHRRHRQPTGRHHSRASAQFDRALPIHKSAVGYGNSRALDFALADAQGSRDCRLVVFVAVGRRLCAAAVVGSDRSAGAQLVAAYKFPDDYARYEFDPVRRDCISLVHWRVARSAW